MILSFLASILVILASQSVTISVVPTPTPTPVHVTHATQVHIDHSPVNDYRISLGLSPLPESPETCAYAEERLEEIKVEFSHREFLEQKFGHGFWVENLGRRYDSEQSVVNAWIASPTHEANLRADVSAICVRSSGTYWVMEGR